MSYQDQYAQALKFARSPELDAHEKQLRTTPNDAIGWAALADHYQDHSEPGAGILKAHADRVQAGDTFVGKNPYTQGWMNHPNEYGNLWQSFFRNHYHDLPVVKNPLLVVREQALRQSLPRHPVLVSLQTHHAGIVHVPVHPGNVEQVVADLGSDGEVIRRAVERQFGKGNS